MKRIEIVMTQAIEVDFMGLYEKACRIAEIKCKFTKIDGVMGQGNTNPKLGDSIWPQLNVMFILVIEDKYVGIIKNIIETLHKTFVGEGVAAFISDADDLMKI